MISTTEFDKLRDLALIRHTVAHHAAVVRAVDVPRFLHYKMVPGAGINPPPEFVQSTAAYLWRISRGIQIRVRNRLLDLLRPTLPPNWREAPPTDLVTFVTFFEHFGFIETLNGPGGELPDDEPGRSRAIEERRRVKEVVDARCMQEIEFPSEASVPPI